MKTFHNNKASRICDSGPFEWAVPHSLGIFNLENSAPDGVTRKHTHRRDGRWEGWPVGTSSTQLWAREDPEGQAPGEGPCPPDEGLCGEMLQQDPPGGAAVPF